MARQRRKPSEREQHEMLLKTAERIAETLKLPPTEVRHQKLVHHNGSHWTVTYQWEKRVADRWIVIEPGEWNPAH